MDKKLKNFFGIILLLLLLPSLLADIDAIGQIIDRDTEKDILQLINEGKEVEARQLLQDGYKTDEDKEGKAGVYQFNDMYLNELENKHLPDAFNILGEIKQKNTPLSGANEKRVELSTKLKDIEDKIKWVEDGGVSDDQKGKISSLKTTINNYRADAKSEIKRKEDRDKVTPPPHNGDGDEGNGGNGGDGNVSIGDKLKSGAKTVGKYGRILLALAIFAIIIILYIWGKIRKTESKGWGSVIEGGKGVRDRLRRSTEEIDEEAEELGRTRRRTSRRGPDIDKDPGT